VYVLVQGSRTFVEALHDQVASYYHDQLYQQSRDMNAYVEYLFHRLVSSCLAKKHERPERYRWLASSLAQERQQLMARTRLSTVRVALGRIQDTLAPRDPTHADGKRNRRLDPEALALLLLTDDILAECLRDVGDFKGAMDHHDEMNDTLAVSTASTSRETANELLRREVAINRALAERLYVEEREGESDRRIRMVDDVALDVEEWLNGEDTGERSKAERLRIKYCIGQVAYALRLMEVPEHIPSTSENALRDQVKDWLDEGEMLLRSYFHAASGPRYKCYLRCYAARFAYLGDRAAPNFRSAYRLLNEAQAAVFQPASFSERTALAVSHLYLAELNMENGRHKIQQAVHGANVQLASELRRMGGGPSVLAAAETGVVRSVSAGLDPSLKGLTSGEPEAALGIPGNARRCAERLREIERAVRTRLQAILEVGRGWEFPEDFEVAATVLAAAPYADLQPYWEMKDLARAGARGLALDVAIQHVRSETEAVSRCIENVAHRLTRRLPLVAARRASELYGRAQVAITQAQSLLSAGIRNAEWWTYLYTLRARLAFEILELEQHARDLDGWNSGIEPSEVLLDALHAIRAGLDNSPHDTARRRRIPTIWDRLRRCYESHVEGDTEESWRRQNARAGLDPARVLRAARVDRRAYSRGATA
jgi:hypothetical protein